MRKALHEIHKALAEHQAAHKAYQSAHDALHETLTRCGKEVSTKAGGDATINGHVGQLTKCAGLHNNAFEVHKIAHAVLHDGVAKAITSIADRAGIPIGYTNPNTGYPTSGRETGSDFSSEGEIDRGVNVLQRSATAKDLAKVLATMQSRMPRFGAGTRQRVNKNASGNPHFGWKR